MRRRGPGARGVACGALAWAVPAVVSLAARPPRAAASPLPGVPAGFAASSELRVCHGPAGAGLPALAPPLLSYPARYAPAPKAAQLALTVLYGMSRHHRGRQTLQLPDGRNSHRLDDATLAATLNFIVFDLGHAPAM